MIYVNRPYVKDEWAESLKEYLLKVPMCNFEERNILEKKIAQYVKAKYCVAVNSGTSALILALMSTGIEIGSEVEIIGPNYSNIAWVSCCRFLKLKPVPVDIKSETLCINPDLIKQAITKRTKAVIFVNHLSYVGDDLKKVRAICDKYKLLMIEDSCSSFASCINGKYAGTFGHVGTYSFSTPKTLSSAEGGAIITDNKKYYEKLKRLQYHGNWYESNHKEYHIGANFNLSPILAHFLNCQLADIDFILNNKRKIYKWYKQFQLSFVDFKTDGATGPNMYCYISKSSQKLQKHLSKYKVETHYQQYVAIHKFLNLRNSDFPVSAKIEKQILTLPGHAHLLETDIQHICEKIRLFEEER